MWSKSLVEEVQELLQLVGFSEDQSQLYVSLLNKATSDNLERVMAESGLPQERVKEAILSLVDRGALRVVKNEVVVVSPIEWLAIIRGQKLREKEMQLEDVESTIMKLQSRLQPIYYEKSAGIRAEEFMSPLNSLKEMEIRTAKVIENAREKISIFAETFGWYPRVKDEMKKARQRGVEARVLMIAPDENSASISKELNEFGVEVRLTALEWYPIRGTLGDDSDLVFLIWISKKDEPKPVHHFPHYTRNPGLIRIFSDAFKQRWHESKPL